MFSCCVQLYLTGASLNNFHLPNFPQKYVMFIAAIYRNGHAQKIARRDARSPCDRVNREGTVTPWHHNAKPNGDVRFSSCTHSHSGQEFSCSGNRLTGKIPIAMAAMTRLVIVDLGAKLSAPRTPCAAMAFHKGPSFEEKSIPIDPVIHCKPPGLLHRSLAGPKRAGSVPESVPGNGDTLWTLPSLGPAGLRRLGHPPFSETLPGHVRPTAQERLL